MSTLTKPKTHIAQVRQDDQSQQQYIQQLLSWTHQEYCDYQFAQYEAYLKSMFCFFPSIGNEIRYSSTFRGFWNNEWSLRNQELMPFFSNILQGKSYGFNVLDVMRDQYFFVHDFRRLMDDEEFQKRYNSILAYIRNKSLKQ